MARRFRCLVVDDHVAVILAVEAALAPALTVEAAGDGATANRATLLSELLKLGYRGRARKKRLGSASRAGTASARSPATAGRANPASSRSVVTSGAV